MWQAICPHWWQAKQTLMQQIALFQAAGALSASQGRVMWPTNSRLRDKLWDDWGTNRTVTVWQTMQVLSDKLSSRCVTSYLSASVTSKTDSYATNRSFSSCCCVVSKSRTWNKHKLSVRTSLCNKSLYYKLQVRCQQVKDALCDQQRAEAQTEQSLCDKLCRYYLTN